MDNTIETNDIKPKYNFYERTTDIPAEFPLKHYSYMPAPFTEDRLAVGIDNGVTNCAFCETKLIYKKSLLTDFQVLNLYCFDNDLPLLVHQGQRPYPVLQCTDTAKI